MFHYYAHATIPPFSPWAHVGQVPRGSVTVKSLIAGVNQALCFPPYAGNNFDALWDSLRTLGEIHTWLVCLVHQDVPDIHEEELVTYVSLLRDAVLFWQERGTEHSFSVWFPRTGEQRIAALLRIGSKPYGTE